MTNQFKCINGIQRYPYRVQYIGMLRTPISVVKWCEEQFNQDERRWCQQDLDNDERVYYTARSVFFKNEQDYNWFLLRWS